MKFFISILAISLPGACFVSAQALLPEAAEIYIEQPGPGADRYLDGYSGAGLQLKTTETGQDELRFLEQDSRLISDSGRIGDWEVLSASASDYGLCVWFDECQDITFNQIPDSFRAYAVLGEDDNATEENQGSSWMDELEEILPEDDDAAMEAFRKAFQAVLAEKENEDKSASEIHLEIDGMVHDETRSKVGREFYDQFYSEWEAPSQARNYSIRVLEAPSPNPGTMVFVEVNQEEVFRYQLQPGDTRLEDAGKYAVKRAYQHLEENKNNLVIY